MLYDDELLGELSCSINIHVKDTLSSVEKTQNCQVYKGNTRKEYQERVMCVAKLNITIMRGF